jgi:hypothetical protein
MRDVLRSKIKRELTIIAGILALAAAFYAGARLAEKQAAVAGPMLQKWASFEQNLAVLGLDSAEIETVVTLQSFMDKLPAFATTDYRQGASYYLSEYPQLGERDAFFALADSAQTKIERAKARLARGTRLTALANVLLWLAVALPSCYPVYFLSRLLLSARRKK